VHVVRIGTISFGAINRELKKLMLVEVSTRGDDEWRKRPVYHGKSLVKSTVVQSPSCRSRSLAGGGLTLFRLLRLAAFRFYK
jgi:hypothetical protein